MKNSKALTFILIWGLLAPYPLLSQSDFKNLQQQMMEMQNFMNVVKPAQDHLNAIKPKIGPAKYGLKCMVKEAYPRESVGLCPENLSEGDVSLGMARFQQVNALRDMAQKYMKDYEAGKILEGNIGGSNSDNQDVSCLNKELENFKRDRLDSRLKRLDNLLSKLDDMEEEFLRNNKKTTDFLKKKYNEMYLGKGVDYKTKFSAPACRSINTPQQYQDMASKNGIKGILEKTKDVRDNSENFMRDSQTIKQDIENSINRAVSRAGSEGLMGFKNSGETGFDISSDIAKTESFKDGIKDLKSRVNEYFNKVDKELKSVLDFDGADKGIYESLTGKNATSGGSEDIEAEYQTWVNKREQKCFYDTFGSNGQQQLSKIFNSFNLRDTKTSSSIRSEQAVELSQKIENILNDSGLGIASKVKKINEFLSSNPGAGNLVVRLGGRFRGKDANHYWKPDELVNAIKNECYARMGSDSYGPRAGKSLKKAMNKVKQLKESVKKQQAAFQENLHNELKAKVLTCTKTSSGIVEIKRSCSAGSMQVKEDFCFRHANDCASDTQKCLGNLQKQFDIDKQTLQNRLKEYNDSLRSLSSQQYNLFKSLKTEYQNSSTAFNAEFNTATFEMPTLADTKIPEEVENKEMKGMMEELDVGMIDPTKLKETLVNNLEKIKEAVKNQNALADKQVKDYITNVTNNYKAAGIQWTKIYGHCSALINAINQIQTGENKGQVNLCNDIKMNTMPAMGDKDQVTSLVAAINVAGLGGDNYSLNADEDNKDKREIEYYQDYFDSIPDIYDLLESLEGKEVKTKISDDEVSTSKEDPEQKNIKSICSALKVYVEKCNVQCHEDNENKFVAAIIVKKGFEECIKNDLKTAVIEIAKSPDHKEKVCKNQNADFRGEGKMLPQQQGNPLLQGLLNGVLGQ